MSRLVVVPVTRDEPTRLLGDVEQDGGRLRDHEAVVVDDRHLMERAKPSVGVTVEIAGGLVERVKAVLEPHFFERGISVNVRARLARMLNRPKSCRWSKKRSAMSIGPALVRRQCRNGSLPLSGGFHTTRRRKNG